MGWAFRGRSEREDRLARLFTVVPPLMNILAFVAVVTIFLIALAFLKIETSIGTFIVTVMLAFPFYHAADSFDMSLMSRVAKRAGPELLSEEDTVWLEAANITLTNGLRFFRNLSLSFALIVGVLGLAQVLTPNLSIASLWFACLACAVALNAVIAPRIGVGQIKYRDDQTPEVALPVAGDHLSYGAPLTFSAHRTRLMKRLRSGKLSESEKDSKSKQ